MKVLLIGDVDNISKKLIDRFLLEGDQVCLIGSIDFDEAEYSEKINFYNVDILDKNVDDIFKVQLPNAVVFLESIQKNFCFDMLIEDVNKHVSRLMRTYHLSSTYGVENFIYVSTTSLYNETNLHSDEKASLEVENFWQDAHYLCEQHIGNTRNTIKMTSTILRISTLYGFEQDEENNPMIIYMNEILNNKRNEYFQQQENIDYLHISDFSNAVCKAARTIYSGVINIASGKYISDNNIKNNIEALINNQEYLLADKLVDGIDVSLAASIIDFVANKDLEKEMRKLVSDRIENSDNQKKKRKFAFKNLFKKTNKRSNENYKMFGLVAFIENLIVFGIICYLVLVKDISMFFGYIDIRILYILLMGAIFGLRQSAISAGLCIILLIYQGIAFGYDILGIIFDPKTMSAIFMFLLSGLLFGYINDIRKQKLNEMARSEIKTKEQLIHMKDMYLDSLRVKDHLQDQIFSTKNSTGKLFNAVSQLNSLDFNELRTEIIKVAEGIMNSTSISLYMFGRNKGYLRLISKSNNLLSARKSITVDNNSLINEIIESKQLRVIDHFKNENDILMAAPIIHNGEVIAMLGMHEAKLEDLTLNYQNLFDIAANLVSQAIYRAYEYQKTQEDVWYIEGTNVMKKEYFKKNLNQSIKFGYETDSKYVVLEIENEITDNLYKDISKYLREFDYIGVGENDKLNVILNDTTINEAQTVTQRLIDNDIITKIIVEKV